MQPGDVVANRFELASLPVAYGKTAAIFRATDLLGGARVALKVSYGRNARDARRFQREAEYLQRFEHPAIVRYVAHGSTAGVAYLALEWLSGQVLEKRLERVGLTLEETLRLMSQAAGALEHAHAHQVMHRDVNPANLFLVEGPSLLLKVLDFGVAGDAHGRGTWDQMSGAPVYMSPEQLGGAVIDWHSDVFSLGCVFYECLAGERPFRGDTLMEVVSSVMLSEPKPLPDLPLVIRPQLTALLSQMLAKEPADRPTAQRIVREIEALGQRVDAPRTRRITKVSSPINEERRLVCVAVAALTSSPSPLDKSTARMADAHSNELAIASDVAAQFGASITHVPGMGLLMVADERYLATDQIALLARCALAVSTALPELGIGVAARREIVRGGGWPFGDAVTIASELAEKARREVLIDASVVDLLGPRFKLAYGPKGPRLHGYDATAELPTTQRDVRFVGRERELDELAVCLERVSLERHAHAVALLAPAGLGKSRLVRESLRRAAGRFDARVLIGRGDPIGAGSPFSVVAQVVRGALDVAAQHDPRRQYAALHERLHGLDIPAHANKIEAYLGAMLGLPSDAHTEALAWAVRDPALMADGIRWAFTAWLRAEAQRCEILVLVVEDMHWGDMPSARLLSSAVGAIVDAPLSIVLLGRPETAERFEDLLAVAQKIALGPLSVGAAERMARALLADGVTDEQVHRLVLQAGHNPLFMRELAALPDGLAEGAVPPENVLATAQANLERLDPPARRILRAASVFGEVFWPSGVVVLLGQWHTSEVARWLPMLEGEGLIERRAHADLDGEPAFAFHAQLLREVAYAMLSDADRVASHRLAAEWLLQHHDTDALLLAEQWKRGGVPARAVEYFYRAAEQAMAGNDFAGVLEHVERAVKCGPRGELLGSLMLLQAAALDWATDHAACASAAEEALAHFPRWSAKWFTAFQLAFIARVRMQGTESVAELCRELVDGAGAMIATEEEVVAVARASGYLTMYGDIDQGRELFRRAQFRAQQFSPLSPFMRGWIGWAKAWQAQASGDLGASLDHDIASMLAFEEAGDLRNLCYARSNVGYAQMRLGLFDEAARVLSEALATATRLDLRTIAAGAAHNLGLAQALLDRHEDALDTELFAVRLFTRLASGRGETMATEYLARIHLARGDLASAETSAREARTMAGEWHSLVALCSATLSRVLLERGAFEEAVAEATVAMDLFEIHGSADGEEHYILAAYAEALAKLGRISEAEQVVADACESLHAAASRISSETIRQTFLHSVPEHRRLLEHRRRIAHRRGAK